MGLPCRHDAAAGGKWNLSLLKQLDEMLIWRRAQQFLLVGFRTIEKAAVFDDYAIEEFEAGEYLAEIRQMPSGHQDDSSTGAAKAFEGRESRVVHNSIVRKSAVVIRRQDEKMHGNLMLRSILAVARRAILIDQH